MKTLRVFAVEPCAAPNGGGDEDDEPVGADAHVVMRVLTSTMVDSRLEGSTSVAVENLLKKHKAAQAKQGLASLLDLDDLMLLDTRDSMVAVPWATSEEFKEEPLRAVIGGGPKVATNQSVFYLCPHSEEAAVVNLLTAKGVVSNSLPQPKGGKGSGTTGLKAPTPRTTRLHYFASIYKGPDKCNDAWAAKKISMSANSVEKGNFEADYQVWRSAGTSKGEAGTGAGRKPKSGLSGGGDGGGGGDDDEDEDGGGGDEDEDEDDGGGGDDDEDEDDDNNDDDGDGAFAAHPLGAAAADGALAGDDDDDDAFADHSRGAADAFGAFAAGDASAAGRSGSGGGSSSREYRGPHPPRAAAGGTSAATPAPASHGQKMQGSIAPGSRLRVVKKPPTIRRSSAGQAPRRPRTLKPSMHSSHCWQKKIFHRLAWAGSGLTLSGRIEI